MNTFASKRLSESKRLPKSKLGQEWLWLRSDRWLLSLVSWLPLLVFFLAWAAFSAGTARDLPIGVVDLDNSQLSRTLTRYYQASPTLAVQQYNSAEEAGAALASAETFATVVVPRRFEQQTLRGEQPQVTSMFNSQYILVGKLVSSAIIQAQGTVTAMVEAKGNMAAGNMGAIQALGKSVPVRYQLVPLFNAGTNYAQFLVSAAIPALWQIIIVASGVFSLALTERKTGLENWLRSRPLAGFAAKTFTLALPLWLLGIVFSTAMHFGAGWPMNGSWLLLFGVQLLMVLAGLGIGFSLYLFTRNATRAMSLAAGFTAPAFAFMGVSFPAGDMPLLAQMWRAVLPVSHYISIQISQFNYGSTLWEVRGELLAMACFVLPWLLVAAKAKGLSGLQDNSQQEAAS